MSTDALVGLLDKLTVDEDGLLKKRREVLRELMLRPEYGVRGCIDNTPDNAA